MSTSGWSKALPVVCLQFLFLVTAASAQNTIRVPADQPTIQQAIGIAQNGDTVLVAPGTYLENIDFLGKAITVASSGGASVTTIDGGNKASVVTFKTSEGNNSILQGFTITHGTASFEGAGIMISSASPTVENNIITANQGCQGVGVAVGFGSPIIRSNTISNNIQATCSGGDGGGISVRGVGTSQILNNIITGNQISGGGDGGGIGLNGSSATIVGNTIQHNHVFNDGGGISLINADSANIIQNLITDNSANGNGGGVFWSVPSGNRGPLLVNNTVANNTAGSGSAAFSVGFVANVRLVNNLFIGHAGAVAVNCDGAFNPTPPTFSFNDVFSNGAAAYAGACPDVTGSNGNISQDPLFVNQASADYHLQSSPAIDAGSNVAPDLPQQDLDNNPRVAIGSAPVCASTIDLGVYEFVLTNAAALSPASLTFAKQAVGATSPSQALTLSATQGCFQISSVPVTGDFAQTNNCPTTLASGNSCSIQVIFSPTAVGPRSGTLAVNGNSQGAAPSATLTGQGGTVVANVSPASLDFGTQLIHTTSAAQVVTLSNSGDLALQISSISTTGDFAQTNNCPASLPSGTSCSINVAFTPLHSTSETGTLTVSSNGGSPVVSLSGTGIAPQMTESPRSLTFPGQSINTTSAAQVITLSNTGTAPLQVSSISTTGEFAQTNNCPASLAPGAACSISVTFTPTGGFTRNGTLVIQSNPIPETDGLALIGTGLVPAPAFAVTNLNFVTQRVNTTSPAQIFTLTNNGNGTLVNNGIFTTDSEFAQTNNCGATLAPNQSCNISVTFTPTSRGAKSATLSLNTSQQITVPTVGLSGTGVAAIASLTPSLAFPAQVVETTSFLNAILANNGDASLDISSIVISGDYSQTNSCPPSLAPGGSCTIQVGFTPATSGLRTGLLTVTDDDLASSQQSSTLNGTGLDYVLSASPASVTITAGATAWYTVTSTASGGAFPNAVSFTCSGIPTRSSCSFSPASVSPGSSSASSTLSIATTSRHGGKGTPAGTYIITVTGKSGNLTHPTTVKLIVQ
jgi:hypothetical protein